MLFDPIGIFDVAEREYAFGFYAFQRRTHGGSTGRKQHFVVVFRIGGSVCTAYLDSLFRRVDPDYFVLDPHVDIETFGKRSRCLHEQFLPFGDCSADVIWQPAVGVRNVFTLFEQDDFGFLVCPANSCRRCRASGDSSDNDVFHVVLFFNSSNSVKNRICMIPTATKVYLFSDKTNFHWKIICPVEVDLFGAVRFAIGGKKELLK